MAGERPDVKLPFTVFWGIVLMLAGDALDSLSGWGMHWFPIQAVSLTMKLAAVMMFAEHLTTTWRARARRERGLDR